MYEPSAVVYHQGSASAGAASPFKLFHLSRNRIWLIAKNYPSPALYWRLPALVFFEVASALSDVFRPGLQLTPRQRLARLRGRFAAFRRLGSALAKRREVHGEWNKLSDHAEDFMEPVTWLRDPFGFFSARRGIWNDITDALMKANVVPSVPTRLPIRPGNVREHGDMN